MTEDSLPKTLLGAFGIFAGIVALTIIAHMNPFLGIFLAAVIVGLFATRNK